MSDAAINGSGVEQVEVIAVHNVLGMRVGERAFLPVDTPELTECIRLDFVRLVVDGMEQLPEHVATASSMRRPCCGGGS